MKRLGLYGAGLFVAHNINGGGSEGGGGSESGVGTTWTLRMMGFRALYRVTYGNGIFVAVGSTFVVVRRGGYYSGTILTSPDGVTWTQQTSGTRSWLRGVTYGNGTFMAVGEEGIILTSP